MKKSMKHTLTPEEIDTFLKTHEPIASNASFAPGEMFGSWCITAFLGRGGSGEVYRVIDSSLGTQAALKVYIPRIDDEASRNAAAKERFMREARFLAKNAHPSFPRFFCFGEHGARPWYVMELLEPLALPSTDRTVAKFILGVAAGVERLHALGFIHRDIKPGNIMRRIGNGTSAKTPVLIDLGLIKNTATIREYNDNSLSIDNGKVVTVGTPKYAAPEQLNGGEITPSTDVYAIGMIANECFGGKPPRAWAHIIRRATASIPGHRYATVSALVRAVRWRHLIRRLFIMTLLCGTVIYSVASSLLTEEIKDATGAPPFVDAGKVMISVGHDDEPKIEPQQAGILVKKSKPRPSAVPPPKVDKIPPKLNETDVVTNVEEVSVTSRANPRYMELVNATDTMSTVDRQKLNETPPILVTSTVSTNTVNATIVHLEGKTVKFKAPLVLTTDKEYWVEGPGTLDADISGPTGSVVRLKDCTLLNRTTQYYPKNGIRYELNGGVYLNFINIKKWPMSLRRGDFTGMFDGAFNRIRFGGPATKKAMMEEERQEMRKDLQNVRF